MAGTRRKLTIVKGETFTFRLRLKSKSTGLGLDLTDYVGRMQVRSTMDATSVLLDLKDADFTFDDQGLCQVVATDEVTAALEVGRGVYDLEIESPAGDVRQLFFGPMIIKPAVTRGVSDPP